MKTDNDRGYFWVGLRAELLELIEAGRVGPNEKLTKTDRGQFLAGRGLLGGLMGTAVGVAGGIDGRRNEREWDRRSAPAVIADGQLA